MNLKRVVATLCIVISIFVMPWWITCILMLLAAVYFNRYWEVLFIGVYADISYKAFESWNILHAKMTLIGLVFFLISTFIRKKLTFISYDS